MAQTATVHEVKQDPTIATMFAHEHAHLVVVTDSGDTIAVPKRFNGGHVCSDADATVLNANRAEDIAALVNVAYKDGEWSGFTPDQRNQRIGTFCQKYDSGETNRRTPHGRNASVQLGVSLLEDAIDMCVVELTKSQNAESDYPDRKSREAYVAKILHSPELTERYAPKVKANIAAILATKHERRARKPAGAKSTDLTL